MNCHEVENKLWFYLEDPQAEDRSEVAAHLQTCARCKHLAHELKMSMAVLDIKPVQNELCGFEDRVMQKIAEARTQSAQYRLQKQNQASKISPMMLRAATAAAVVVGLFLGVALGNIYPIGTVSSSTQNNEQVSNDTYYLDDFNQESMEYALLVNNEE